MKTAYSTIVQKAMALVLLPLAYTGPGYAGTWELDRYEYTADGQKETVYAEFPYWNSGDQLVQRYKKETTSGTSRQKVIPVSEEAKARYPDSENGSSEYDGRGAQVGWETGWNAQNQLGDGAATTPPAAQARVSLTIRAIFKWKPAWQPDPDFGIPSDPPPDHLYISEFASVTGGEGIWQNDGWGLPFTAENPFKGKHYEFVNIDNGFGDAWNFNGYSQNGSGNPYQGAGYTCQGTHYTKIGTGGSYEVQGPTRTLKGLIKLNPTYPQEPSDTSGSASISPFYYAGATSALPGEPSVTGDPERGQNEYVMSGAAPFAIPCRIYLPGNAMGSDLVEYLRPKARWELSRGLPKPLPAIENGAGNDYQVPDYAYGTFLFPQFHSDLDLDPPTPEVLRGLGFSTRTGLPGSNGDFGKRNVMHKMSGQVIGTAPIEVFYASTETSHEAGGPPGYANDFVYNGNLIAGRTTHTTPALTPNWFFYYNQAWPASGATVEYVNDTAHPGLNAMYVRQDDHVHMVAAHGERSTKLFAFEADSNTFPFLSFVGEEVTRGIDTYARLLTHELKHKEMFDRFQSSIEAAENNSIPDGDTTLDPDADPDNDGLPSQFEESIGLNPLHPDSTNAVGSGVLDPEYYDNDPNSNKTKGDFEVVARMAEKGIFGPKDKDWADDGLNRQWIHPDPNYRFYRTKLLDKQGNIIGYTY